MILYVFIFLAPVLGALLCYTASLSGVRCALMFVVFSFAFFAALCLFFLLFVFISSLFIDRNAKPERMSAFYRFILIEAIIFILAFCGVKVRTKGLENIPSGRTFLLVGNHSSGFDPIVALYALRKYKLAFVTKPENMKIKMVGNVLHRCFFLPIDRDDNRRALETIITATDLVKNEICSVGIYPEGTRNHTENSLLPFKPGAFKIAQRAMAPIVVASVSGASKVHKRFLPTTVDFTVCGVIDPSAMPRCTTQLLSAEVRAILCKNLNINEIQE